MKKIGSSETIRKTTLDFNLYNNNCVQHKRKTSTAFLEWFVGFAEGDCSFIISNGRLFFIINQKEERVLHYIRTNLGFGKVSTYKHYSRYIVASKENTDRLILLFNGNLVLGKTNNRFLLWLKGRNLYSREEINPLPPAEEGGLPPGGWLSGFIDAEGCFNVNLQKSTKYALGFRVRLRFLLGQKGERGVLLHVQRALGGGYVSSGGEEMWRYTLDSNSGFPPLLLYLERHPLRTLKRVAFLRWLALYRYIIKRTVLPWRGKVLHRVLRLVKNINKKS